MKSSLAVILVVIMAVAVLALMRRGAHAPDVVIASDDGSAELRIPDGALPQDVAPESISVKRVAVEADGLLAKYDLQPSGLAFSKPATLVMRVPLPPQPSEWGVYVDVPTVILQDADGKAVRLASDMTVDTEKMETEVRSPVAHFSDVTVVSFLTTRIDEVGDKLVDAPFLSGARATQERTEVRVPIQGDPNHVAYVFTAQNWYLFGGLMYADAGIISPSTVEKVPEAMNPAAGPDGRKTYGFVRRFVCEDVGDARMGYRSFTSMDIDAALADAQDRRTPIDFDGGEADDTIRAKTRPFRCLSSVDEAGQEILIDGGGTGSATTTVQASKGQWDVSVKPSATRVALGEGFTVDVTITDVTDRLLETVNEPARYRTPWEASGEWHITDGIYDRGPTVVAERRESPYGARLTYRLPMQCEHPGVGPISLELSIGRVLQPTPSLISGLPARVEMRLPAVYVECIGPSAPPQEPMTQPIRFNVTPTTIQEVHRVGATSCPQGLGAFRVDGPAGSRWTATGIPEWLDMPSSGEVGEVEVEFNCDIEDTSPHKESATLTFSDGTIEQNVTVGIQVKE